LRRIVTFALLGLGVFAVALGLLLRLYAYPHLAKIPLDVNTTVYLEGSNVTALEFLKESGSDTTLPVIKTGLTVRVEQKVIGDLSQPEVVKDGNVASYIQGIEVVDSSGNRVQASERQLCVDRRTTEAVQPCTTQYVQDKSDKNYAPVRENGVFQPGMNFKLPFDTQKQSYQWFDLSLRASFEAKFDGEEQIDGLDTYRFVQDIPSTKLEVQTVPGSLVGKPDQASLDADLFYRNKRTLWVEPSTGAVVKDSEQQHQELRPQGSSDSSTAGTAVFDGTLTLSDADVTKLVSDVKDNKSKLSLLTTFPIWLWVGGTVAIVVAVLLLFFWRGRRDGADTTPDPPQQRELADASH
jgi:hypothetical protein